MELSTLLKLVGGAFLIVGCTLFGRSYGNQYRERVDYLCDFQKRLEVLKNEIAFLKGLLSDSIRKAADFPGPAKVLLETVLARLEEDPSVDADTAWKTACETALKEFSLTVEEKNIIGTLGRLLGASDVEGQLANIEAIQGQILLLQEKAEEARKKNEPMWKKVGPIVGAAIAIVLF